MHGKDLSGGQRTEYEPGIFRFRLEPLMLGGPEGLQRWPVGKSDLPGVRGGYWGATPISRALESIVLIIPGVPGEERWLLGGSVGGQTVSGARGMETRGLGRGRTLTLRWLWHHPHFREALGMGPVGSLGLPPSQGGPIVSRDTGRCLEVEMSKDANFGLRLVVQRCSGQKWTIRNWIKPGRH